MKPEPQWLFELLRDRWKVQATFQPSPPALGGALLCCPDPADERIRFRYGLLLRFKWSPAIPAGIWTSLCVPDLMQKLEEACRPPRIVRSAHEFVPSACVVTATEFEQLVDADHVQYWFRGSGFHTSQPRDSWSTALMNVLDAGKLTRLYSDAQRLREALQEGMR